MQVPALRSTRWWALSAIAVFALGLVLTLGLWRHDVRQQRQQLEREFEARNSAVQTAVQQRLGVYSQALRSAAALFDASGEVSRESWRRFIAGMRLQENYPGLVAMAYARSVDDAQLQAVIEQAQRDGIAEYAMRPAGQRQRYVVNFYAEPTSASNRRALGYDMYQDPERRAIMDIARDTASARITAKVGLKIDAEQNPKPAVIMYLPVYRNGVPDTPAARRDRLLGFVLCPFRMPELMQAALGRQVDDIGLALYDGDLEDEAHLFYRNASFDSVRPPLLHQRRSIEFGGRKWTLAFNSTPNFENHQGRNLPYAVLGVGLTVTLAITALLLSLASARRRAVVLAGQMTKSFRASQKKWHLLFREAPLGIVLLNQDGQVTDCNQAYCKMIDASRLKIIGFNALSDARDDSLKPWLRRALAGEQVSFESAYCPTVGTISGHFRYHFQPIEQDDNFSMLLCFIEDISVQHRAAERIVSLAQHDSLTGLANRFLLNDRLSQAILAAGREEDKRPAVLFLDLDHFKTINDSLGHTLGDTILVEVARRLEGALRECDTVARLGGDEFVIVLRDVESSEAAARVAEKVVACITAPVIVAERSLDVTGSIGIAMFPADGRDADALIKNADAAMYHAKELGRNNFQFFTADMNARVVEALAMETALRHALRNDEFLLHYQPQMAIDGNTVVGIEALIRWQRPGVGMVPPNSFIPTAESRGLINAIGEWVLNRACRQNRQWQDQGLPAIPVAVNISTLQLRNNALVEVVRRALDESGLEARYLELEITESALAHNIEFAIALIGELKALGVHIAIDDFGTGYSSLSYLKRFPIDKLKIDQSFIRDITTDQDDAAITQAIAAMGKSLGMKVIAEGVETLEQLQFLQLRECDEAQGYLFSRPIEAAAIPEYLDRYRTGAGNIPDRSA